MKKYIIASILTLIEILSVVFIYLIDYFTKTRMGMQRYLYYLNNKLDISIGMIKILISILIIILLISVLVTYFKKKDSNLLIFILTLVINITILIFTNLIENLAFYFISLASLIIIICQNTLFYLLRKVKY